VTDKIDKAFERSAEPATCRCCGKTALYDQVKLTRVEQAGSVDKWQCETSCEKNKKKIRVSVSARNGTVRISELWTNSLLERLSCRLSPRTSSLEETGEPSKLACPKHYAFDVMLPLVHASKHEPLGWLLFGAKYLHNTDVIRALVKHVTTELSKYLHTEEERDTVGALARLAVGCYCTGLVISERQLRRDLDIGRGTHRKYQTANADLQSHFHMVEESYARAVKKYL